MQTARIEHLQTEIMKFCILPKTINEVKDEFNCSYHTARNHMQFLKSQGVLLETIETRDKAGLWKTNPDYLKAGGWAFKVRGKTYNPTSLLKFFTDKGEENEIAKITRTVGAVIANQYRLDKANRNKETIGGLPSSSEDSLLFVKYLKERLEDVVKLLEQVIAAPIWDGEADVWLKEFEEIPKDTLRNMYSFAHETYIQFDRENRRDGR